MLVFAFNLVIIGRMKRDYGRCASRYTHLRVRKPVALSQLACGRSREGPPKLARNAVANARLVSGRNARAERSVVRENPCC
jgi:hypothetical protein